MNKTFKDLIIIAFIVILLTFLVWLPHLLALPSFWGLNFSNGFSTIYRNFDGLEYIVIAKSFYDPELIKSIPNTLSPNYYASHFPLYSVFIAFFAILLGFLKSMLFTTILFTILSAWAFYILVRDFKLSSNPLFLTMIFLILPARWLIVHSVGSSEPTFIFFIIMTTYFFMKATTTHLHTTYYLLLTTLFGAAAQLTRPPAILLFIAFALYILWKTLREGVNFDSIIRIIAAYLPLGFIPLSLFLIFLLYSITYQDFFAYFHSGDNIHLTFPPLQVFNKNQFWVGDIWLEDLIYIFILGFLGGIMLWRKKLYPLSIIVLTYLAASTLIAHRDISRYILPITPFILIAFEKVLISKEFKIILPIILLAIYLYAQNFILSNTAPIPNLSIYN